MIPFWSDIWGFVTSPIMLWVILTWFLMRYGPKAVAMVKARTGCR